MSPVVLMTVYGPRPFCSRSCYLRWPGPSAWKGGQGYYPEAAGEKRKETSKLAGPGGTQNACNHCGTPMSVGVALRAAA